MRDHFHSRTQHGEATRGHVIHWAPVYDWVFGGILRRTHGAVVDLAALSAGKRALDVGCGTGSLAVALKASAGPTGSVHGRSEEHTSELQSRENLVCRLLLE